MMRVDLYQGYETRQRRMNVFISVVVLACWLTGCAAPAIPAVCEESFNDANTVCEGIRLSAECQMGIDALIPDVFLDLFDPVEDQTLTEIPEELEFVLANRARFDATDHPLMDATLGSGETEAAQLMGCWARVQIMTLEDGSAEWVEAEFMEIDLANARIESVVMKGVDGQPCLNDARPYILVNTNRIVGDSNGSVTIEGIGDFDARTTAGLNPDGSLSSHFIARLEWELGLAPPFEKLLTLEGDFLATSIDRGQFGPPNRDLWIRLNCSDVGGAG